MAKVTYRRIDRIEVIAIHSVEYLDGSLLLSGPTFTKISVRPQDTRDGRNRRMERGNYNI